MSKIKSLIFIQSLFMFIPLLIFSAEFKSTKTEKKAVSDDKQVELLLTSDKDVYTPCEPIILSITATNITDSTMTFFLPPSFGEDQFTFSVKNNSENKVSNVTSYGWALYKNLIPGSLSGHFLKFKPDDTYTKKFQIDRMYDMSMSGDYIISASFACLDYKTSTASNPKTNSIQIKILNENPSTKDDSDIILPPYDHKYFEFDDAPKEKPSDNESSKDQ